MKPLLLTLAVVLVVAEDQLLFGGFSNDTNVEYIDLPLKEGCTSIDQGGSITVECYISGTKFSYDVNRAATSVTVTYETNSPMICEHLFEAKPLVDAYLSLDERIDVYLDFLTISSVSLSNESLVCPLTVLGTNRTKLIRLKSPSGELLPHHLEGIQGVRKFEIFGIGKDVTRVPYAAISQLTALERATFKGGTFELREEKDEYLLPNLKILEISQGGLKTLPGQAFKNTPALTTLLLYSNKIEHVHVDAFKGLTDLSQLSIAGNRIRTLPVDVFQYSRNLTRIDIYDNVFTNLTDKVFSGLTLLEKVLIFSNKANLTFYGGVFSNLPALNYLQIESGCITNLPPNLILDSPNIQEFKMRNNSLETIPPHFFSASSSSLKTIDLSHNRLTSLQRDQLSNLTALTKLNLTNNSLANFSVEVFSDLAKLEVLLLKNNKIESLPPWIFRGLKNLRELYLDGNRIKVLLADTFDVVTTLRVLSLNNNNLTISKTMNTKVAIGDFVSYESGSGLDASRRQYWSRFSALRELVELHLAGNRVSVVCDDWQDTSFNLAVLDLSRNSFTQLTSQDTFFVSNTTVDFSDNSIETVDLYTYGPDVPRPTLRFGGNRLRCSCELFRLVSAAKALTDVGAPRVELGDAVCAAPPELLGTRLADLRVDVLTCAVPCPEPCRVCLTRPAKSHLELTCDAAPAALPPPPPPATYVLRLTSAVAAAGLSLDLPGLEQVDLAGLGLETPPDPPTSNRSATSGTLVLDLRRNALRSPPGALLRAGVDLYLADNPLQCGCAHAAALRAVAAAPGRVRDLRDARCAGGGALEAAARAAAAGDLCASRAPLLAAAAALLALLLALALAACAYAQRTRLLLLWHKWRRVRARDDLEYDLFVSYAHEDEQFVRAVLVPRLESGTLALRLCVHARDWRLGDAIAEQVQRSVERSLLTLAVVSPAYLASGWCAVEVRAAHARGRLLVLVLDEAAMATDALATQALLRQYVRTNTYVRASHPRVWDKVREAVLRRRARAPRAIRALPAHEDKPRGLHATLTDDGKIVNAALTRA